MVQTLPKTPSLEEFLTLPETKPASEFVDGKITQKPMPQGQHSAIQGELVTVLNAFTKPNRIAWAFPELRCTFGNRSTVPDVVVFTWERLATNDDGTIANQFTTAPDWTIEILSPEQTTTRVTRNILHCLAHGTQIGWLIDPNEKLIFTYTRDRTPCYFEVATDILPVPEFAQGLQLTLGQIFDWLQVR
jgi:Uma2 family endonuclease